MASEFSTTAEHDIACPPWCVTTTEYHADELDQMGGYVYHSPDDVYIDDKIGRQGEYDQPGSHFEPLRLSFSLITNPDGSGPVATPAVIINEAECSVEQAMQLAAEIIGRVSEWTAATTATDLEAGHV